MDMVGMHAMCARWVRVVGVWALLAVLAACQTAPVTGRQQVILLPDSQANALGVQAYNQIKSEETISRDRRFTEPVERIGREIAAISPDPNLAWEFTVFENPQPNAFALPGGKVGVNTGLFTVARTEDQLAAVMAHEVGHAVARHSAERMTRQVGVQLGVAVLGSQAPELAGLLANGATLGLILPFNRSQESEADAIGLNLMARAGYDPRAAIDLWRNFEAAGSGGTPEFLSTHPLPDSRIRDLERMMPAAVAIFEANRG